MSVELTPLQQEALDREGRGPRRVVDPRTRAAYVLVPENEYEAMRELLEDERRERVIHAVALRNSADRLNDGPKIRPGEIYMADFGPAGPHPVIVASREALNRG